MNYTIPRKIRELQFKRQHSANVTIILYQEKLGNYNARCNSSPVLLIILYQEKLGNYNGKNNLVQQKNAQFWVRFDF